MTVQMIRQIGLDGATTESFTVNLGEAPVPERSYGSDVFAVSYAHGVVNIYFGQTKASDPAALHSLLAIRMSPTSTHNFISSLVEGGASSTQRSLEATLLAQRNNRDEPFVIVADPDHLVKLTANFAVTAVSNGDACLDFMNASPFSMVAMQSLQKLAVQPVVRVELPSPQLLGLIKSLKSLQNELPPPLMVAK